MTEEQKRIANNLRQTMNNCLFGYICNSIVSLALFIGAGVMFAKRRDPHRMVGASLGRHVLEQHLPIPSYRSHSRGGSHRNDRRPARSRCRCRLLAVLVRSIPDAGPTEHRSTSQDRQHGQCCRAVSSRRGHRVGGALNLCQFAAYLCDGETTGTT